SASNLASGDTLASITSGSASWTTSAGSTSDIGSYAIEGTGLTANSGNYSITFEQAAANATALTITPRAAVVTYTADALSSIYGDTPGTVTGAASVSNLASGDTLASITSGSASWTTSAGSTSDIGSYAIEGTGLSLNSGNYSVTFEQAAANATALTITPRAAVVTYTADALSSIYGDTPGTMTGAASASNLASGDTLASITSGSASWTTGATSASDAGSYAIEGSGLAVNSGNYSITFDQAAANATALTITPRAAVVTYTADALSSIYGDAPGTMTGTASASNLVGGDTLASITSGSASWTTGATSASDAGSYAIEGTGLTVSSGNYSITFEQAAANATALTITPRAAVVTYTADALSSIYGDAPGTMTGTASASNLASGDTLASITSGSASWTTSAGSTSDIGSYAIEGSGLSLNSGNYSVTFEQAAANATALTITRRALVVTANGVARSFGADNPALTYSVGGMGLVNGDTLSGVLSTEAGPSSEIGIYPILQGTLSASDNYVLTYNGADFRIVAWLPPGTSGWHMWDAIPVTEAPEIDELCTSSSSGGVLGGGCIIAPGVPIPN
ncbi:beta strand repeat-containing protein, partial [Aurantiacibacter flavus]